MVSCYLLVRIIYLLFLFLMGGYIRVVEIFEKLSSFVNQDFNELPSSYDYIVAGCGSAGSTIAYRLAQDSNTTVLVLEAGIYGNKWFDIPILGPLFQQSAIDWKFQTVPQSNAAKAYFNNVVNWPQGRIVGGSGRINSMVYIRGHSNDFNEWYDGISDYNYESDILNYFKKAEDQRGIFINDSTFHGTGGPLIVEDLTYATPFADLFLQAVEILGFPVRDLNGADSTGFMQIQRNSNAGQRWTPAHTILSRNRQNLHILTNSLVSKVLFKDSYEAYAVQFLCLGHTKVIHANKGVILSAGAIGTPKILMLSGIGHKQHLKDVNIEAKIDLPVGDNLQDHVITGLDLVLLNATAGFDLSLVLSPKALFDYFYYGVGSWTTTGCEVVGILDTCSDQVLNEIYYKSSDTTNFTKNSKLFNKHETCTIDIYHKPDLQFMVLPNGVSVDGGMHLKKVFNFKDNIWNEYFAPLVGDNVISIMPIVLHPKSRGIVRLLDNNPRSLPVINPNYLSHPYDVEILLKGIEFIKSVIKTPPMQKVGAKLNTQKFPGCEEFEFDTKLYWECYVRHFTASSFHPAGTCKMGKLDDTGSVVNHNFAVHKTNKLFVVDASVMPSLPSGNINAAVMMLAEKAADLVLWKDYLNSGSCSKLEIFLPKLVC